MDTPQLLRLNELAADLGVSQAWLRGEAEAGRIPFVQASRVRLFSPDAVRRALAEQATKIHPLARDTTT